MRKIWLENGDASDGLVVEVEGEEGDGVTRWDIEIDGKHYHPIDEFIWTDDGWIEVWANSTGP